jgi:hypothetical protein
MLQPAPLAGTKPGGGAMSEDSKLIALIDFIYAAALDADLWPTVLAKLADATGALQAIIATMDRRTDTFASISRRAYPDLEASYKDYWAFRNPLWDNATALPAGEVFSLDTLMPRQDFVKTPVFNEWWKTADTALRCLAPFACRRQGVVVDLRRQRARERSAGG